MNIDYNLYKIFLYLYEEKSISKTAHRLYVSQPAISYSLKELESQLGYKLFYRNSKGIEPTTEAKELYSFILAAFNILNDAEEHIKNLNSLNTGSIKIGISAHIGDFYLSKYITDFRKLYPGIKFEIICKPTEDMLHLLETRKLDIIIDTLPIDCKKNITKVALAKLPNCFVYNKKAFKDIEIKNISDLKKYPLILPSSTSSIRTRLNEFLESQNITLEAILESQQTEMMLEMVRQGVGIGYFIKDLIARQADQDNFEVLAIADDIPAVDICCLYIDEFLTKAPLKFLKTLNCIDD